MGKYNFGFSFIIQPPHDFLRGENYFSSLNKMLILGSLISTITIFITLYMLYNSSTIGLLSISLFTFGLSYFFQSGGITRMLEALSRYIATEIKKLILMDLQV